MVVGIWRGFCCVIALTIEGGVIDIAESLQFLGSAIQLKNDGELQIEVSQLLAKAAGMFKCLH